MSDVITPKRNELTNTLINSGEAALREIEKVRNLIKAMDLIHERLCSLESSVAEHERKIGKLEEAKP